MNTKTQAAASSAAAATPAGVGGGQSTGTMKALVYDRYGLPDVLRVERVEIPAPRRDEVLIAVKAASVNSWDWDLLRGKPFITRLGGWFKPRYRILGADVAGRVVAAGPEARRYRPGDEVFGDISGCGWGGFAEYVCASESALTPKPAGLSFGQAAAIPQAAVLALQALRDQGGLQEGQEVLINGAGGGVGTFGIQYAKRIGARATGVDSAAKLAALQALGADRVIDYTAEDFTTDGRQYDLIVDVVGTRSLNEIKRALKPGGAYVMVGGSMPRLLQAVLAAAPLSSGRERKRTKILMHRPNHDDQLFWKTLAEAGQVVPVVDREYSLDDAAAAIQYLGEGRAIGKVVVCMDSSEG